jgi:N-alpha-acetyltransferase 50
MAYQFFAKAPHPALPLSAPSISNNNVNARNKPPLHPPSLVLPQPAESSKSSSIFDPAFQPSPYPVPNPSSYPTPHPQITIDAIRTVHIPSLSRTTSLLLPIRYPSSFYTACITDPVIASLSRVAIYHDYPIAPVAESRSIQAKSASNTTSSPGSNAGIDKVIGGIRCRLERLRQPTSCGDVKGPQPTNLYIQTLHLLSPHRRYGVATSLLNSLLFSIPPSSSQPSYRVSPLVKHYNIRTVTAHVHQDNEEALRWYAARGFHIEDVVIESYYRRLKSGGARIVRLDLQWDLNEDENGPDNTKKSNDSSERGQRLLKEEDDEDWEKVEIEDEDQDGHGVKHLTDTLNFDNEDGLTRKRKADEDLS